MDINLYDPRMQWPAKARRRILTFAWFLIFVALFPNARAIAQDHDKPHLLWPDDRSVVDTVRSRGLLKVGVGLFEPWVMCDTNGDLIGYEVDVARKMAEDMGVQVQFVRTDWYYIIPALIEEEFDVVISGMGVTPERSLMVNFSVPYAEFGTSVVANTTHTRGLTTLDDFDSVDIVFGARSGTVPRAGRDGPFSECRSQVFRHGYRTAGGTRRWKHRRCGRRSSQSDSVAGDALV